MDVICSLVVGSTIRVRVMIKTGSLRKGDYFRSSLGHGCVDTGPAYIKMSSFVV